VNSGGIVEGKKKKRKKNPYWHRKVVELSTCSPPLGNVYNDRKSRVGYSSHAFKSRRHRERERRLIRLINSDHVTFGISPTVGSSTSSTVMYMILPYP
jgi:hypothetical protein